MTTELLDSLQLRLILDLFAFGPELVLCLTIVLLLVLRLFSALDRTHLGIFALIMMVVGLAWAGYQGMHWFSTGLADPRFLDAAPRGIFSGLLAYDNFTIFLKLFLFLFAALIIWLSLLTGIPDREDSADFYVLIIGATLGMTIMASANHLLMVFIGVEMASLPSYALAGFLKGKRQSSEAALKYVVYGGGASGVMLYGISLLAGKFGSGQLSVIAAGLVNTPLDGLVLLGLLFVLIGIAFKLAAVPFHFWCPDVFEGASAEVAGFLSVASKGAALALLGRFAFTLAGMAHGGVNYEAWARMAPYLVPALAFFATLTATFGNLAALPQTNLKRLLAYSTIAQAGYMMMGIATLTTAGGAAVLFYLVVYLFMNLGAFAIVAFLRNLTGSEDLADFRGLVTRAPVLVVCLAICLLSLLGLPPLAGFAAKFQIFRVLFDAGNMYNNLGYPWLSGWMYALLFVLGVNSVISLVYYVKVLKVMVLDKPLEEVEGQVPARLPVKPMAAVYSLVMGGALLVLGILWGPLSDVSSIGVDSFQNASPDVQLTAMAQENAS